MTIGLTGGIATGKSTVLQEFRRLGAKIVDCDRLARGLVKRGTPSLAKIRREFGASVIRKNGSLNRAELGRIAFSNPSKRAALERIIHPEVKKKVLRAIKKIKKGVIVVDVPLLFEAGWKGLFDKTVLVWAPEKAQFKRLWTRNRLPREEALRRIRAQMPLKRKKNLADFVLVNSGPKSAVLRRARRLWEKIVTFL